MIPKTIHYCWFGRNPKPKLAEKCLKSWKKYCKGYEIKEWNEDNFDISSAPLYVRQAYEAKKWAFVSDYVRLWAMVKYGGIYMDTDVEVIKPIDKFLENEAFSGFESKTMIPTGIMACEKDFPLFSEFLKEYDNNVFIYEDGSLNLETNVTKITRICLAHGFIPNGEYQVVNGFAIYPKEYFCPRNGYGGHAKKTKNTYTDHHFTASWASSKSKAMWKKESRQSEHRKFKNKLKYRIITIFDIIIHTPNILLKKILGEKKYTNLKKKLKGKKYDS